VAGEKVLVRRTVSISEKGAGPPPTAPHKDLSELYGEMSGEATSVCVRRTSGGNFNRAAA
jgi:hypothetical protein